MDDSNAQETRQLDARSLRALAHPMRVEILSMLRVDGPATMTMLADRLNQRTGTVAWHVKQLAKHELIEEIVDRGVGRERWWRASQRRTELNLDNFVDDPAVAIPLQAYVEGLLTTNFRRAAKWLSGEWDTAWTDSATVSDWTVRMNPAELGALVEELRSVIERHSAAAGPDGTQVFVQLQAFPNKGA